VLPALAAVATIATLASCAKENNTIIDYGPADPPAGELDPHIEARIETGGGMGEAPEGSGLIFELHDDGSVFTAGSGPFELERYRLTPEGIERAHDLLGDIELDDTAYGEPGITDMPSTSVYVNLDGQPGDLSVYALTDADDFGDLGLSADQQAARAALMTTLDDLGGLADDAGLVAEPPEAYVPERLDVSFIPWVDGDDGSTGLEPLLWPLDTPLTDRTLGWDRLRLCTTVEGDEATTLIETMAIDRTGPQNQPWSTGAAEGSSVPTAVAAQVHGLRPGEDACGDRAEPEGTSDPPLLDAGPLYPIELSTPDGWDGALPADSFRPAQPLEVYAVVPAVAAAVADDPATNLSDTDLTWYDFRAIVAVADGTTYVDVEASPTAGSTPDPDEPTTWRARTDLATGEVTTIEAD
jgi:hypothetical protein